MRDKINPKINRVALIIQITLLVLLISTSFTMKANNYQTSTASNLVNANNYSSSSYSRLNLGLIKSQYHQKFHDEMSAVLEKKNTVLRQCNNLKNTLDNDIRSKKITSINYRAKIRNCREKVRDAYSKVSRERISLIKKYGFQKKAAKYLKNREWWSRFRNDRKMYKKYSSLERKEFSFRYPNLIDAAKYDKMEHYYEKMVQRMTGELAFKNKSHYGFKLKRFKHQFDSAKTYRQQNKAKNRIIECYNTWIKWKQSFLKKNRQWYQKDIDNMNDELKWSQNHRGRYGVRRRINYLNSFIRYYTQMYNSASSGDLDKFIERISGIRMPYVESPERYMQSRQQTVVQQPVIQQPQYHYY